MEAEKNETAWAEAILSGQAEIHSPNGECETCGGVCKYSRQSDGFDETKRNGIWRVSTKDKRARPLK